MLKEKTLRVLQRVQAIREQRAERTLAEAAERQREAEETAESLAREQECVERDFGVGWVQSALAEHASRYRRVLSERQKVLQAKLEELEETRREAREAFARVRQKSELLARHSQALERAKKSRPGE